jgi:hypothetical protein
VVKYNELCRRINAYSDYLKYKMKFASDKRDLCEPGTPNYLRWTMKYESFRTAVNQLRMHIMLGQCVHKCEESDDA